MIELIPLERIDDNPYQTRTVYNTEAIEELAADIKHLEPARPETLGLIQVPLGRLVYHEPDGTVTIVADPLTKLAGGQLERLLKESENFRIQLAAGHSRLRAFWKLAEADVHWSVMPVDLANLTDSEMADIAWSENAKRRNISAIEEAEAIERAKTELGYTSADIQERWGLSGSAISNKTRLLQLPLKVKDMVKAGDLKERHARELLPLVQVLKDDKAALKAAKEAIKEGRSANQVAYNVASILERKSWKLPVEVMHFDRWNGHQLPPACQFTCHGCEFRSKDRCLKPGAAQTKHIVYDQATLELAADTVGLPAHNTYWEHTPESYAVAKDRNCERLAITRSNWTHHPVVAASEEFENIYYTCLDTHKCQCRQVQKAAEEAENEDPWAAFRAWKSQQEAEGRRIFDETRDHLEGAFESALSRLEEKELIYFFCLLKRASGYKWNVDDEGLQFNNEAISKKLAVATVHANQPIIPRTTGHAFLHRAELYQLCQINTPLDEVQARLVIIEELFTEKSLSPAHGPSDFMFTNQFERCDEILKAHPGHADLRQKLADYKARYAEEF